MAAIDELSTPSLAALPDSDSEIRKLSIDTIRGLAMDAVQKANAGHPGTAMALAPLGYTLYRHVLGSTRSIRAGATATASCSAPAMRASCNTRSPICAASTYRSRI